MGCGSSSEAGTQSSGSNKPTTKTESEPAGNQGAASTQARQETASAAPKQEAGNEFLEDGVKAHNALRAKHGAEPLTPSADLTKFSQKWADTLAKKDSMEHSSNGMREKECGGAGENLYMCWSSSDAGVTADSAVQSWYDEIKDYDFGNSGFAMNTGHFTQVVWKGSRELGMAWAKSKGGSYYVVANYRPAGNYMGQFDDNVVPPS